MAGVTLQAWDVFDAATEHLAEQASLIRQLMPQLAGAERSRQAGTQDASAEALRTVWGRGQDFGCTQRATYCAAALLSARSQS